MGHLRAVLLLLLVAGSFAGRPATATADWVSPLTGPLVVRRGFHPPAERWLSGHRGVDLAGAVGQVVRAAGAGVVTFAGLLAGRGVVVVNHGDLRTTYEPVEAVVAVGARVLPGESIGRLVPGHGAPAPAQALLHWGLLRGDAYLNPLTLLRRGPPRLLPLWNDGVFAGPGAGSTGLTLPRHRGVDPAHSTAPARQRGSHAGPGALVAGAATVGAGGVAALMAVRRRRVR